MQHQPIVKRVNGSHEWAHRPYQPLITAACTNTGGKMKVSQSRAADRYPFVLRHSLSQVTSFMQLGMLWPVTRKIFPFDDIIMYPTLAKVTCKVQCTIEHVYLFKSFVNYPWTSAKSESKHIRLRETVIENMYRMASVLASSCYAWDLIIELLTTHTIALQNCQSLILSIQ